MNSELILSRMTLRDKIRLCSGASFWKTKEFKKYKIPAMLMCDGPHGLRKQESITDMLGVHSSKPATCFPAAVTVSQSWDAELCEKIGAAIGEEALSEGVGLVLGPGCNLKRNPLCGRNFEYFSEDPLLAGKLAAGFIRGCEERGVFTSLKHFAANSQETNRFISDGVMDERTLREMYLAAFEIAVREGKPSTVMCAYPKLNGTHLSDNKQLLTDILRSEWGFDGVVVTDWGALNDRLEAFRAGCDLCMPGGSRYMEKEALRAVRAGSLDEAFVNASAERILKMVLHAKENMKKDHSPKHEEHHRLAVSAAAAGGVLLKNEGGLLPLSKETKIALFGHMAMVPRYQGTGSSHIVPTRLTRPLDGFPGCTYEAGCDADGNTTEEMLKRAEEAAGKAQTAIVFAGLTDECESEGVDRAHMKMQEGQIRLIERVCEANENTVVVLLSGSPVECPWADAPKAILYMGLPGQGGAEAVSDLIYGRVDPSGRLAESWPLVYEDVPSSHIYAKGRDALYMEGVYVGYRYYDTAKKPVRWRFGYGLSYTEFAYEALSVSDRKASVTVKNIGKRAGSEVVQMYVLPPRGGLNRPVRELKGFLKVHLEPGECKRVEFLLDDRCFSVYDGGWRAVGGEYTVEIGTLFGKISVSGEEACAPAWQKGSFYETLSGKPVRSEFENMLGRKHRETRPVKGEFGMDSTPLEMQDASRLMRGFVKMVTWFIKKRFGGKNAKPSAEMDMMLASSVGAPLRNLQICGGVPGGVMKALLFLANGRAKSKK